MLIEFASVIDAVRCAVEVQRMMAERNATVPAEQRIEFRVGINLGDIIIEEGDIFGDGVNVAARLEALAAGRGLTVGEWVREVVLKAGEPQPASAAEQTLLSEVLALRAILINTVYDLASGDGMTPERMKELIAKAARCCRLRLGPSPFEM